MKVAVTGSSGLVGQALVPFLQASGHEVLRIVRETPRAKGELHWDPDRGEIDGPGLEGVDAFVHLAGENLAERALDRGQEGPPADEPDRADAAARRRRSRASPASRRVLVSASAVGYYGDRGDDWLDETSPPGADFLARLCVEWEEATESAARAGIRVVRLRTGVVLSRAAARSRGCCRSSARASAASWAPARST